MVAVALLNQLKVADHLIPRHGMTYIGPVLVPVDSLKLDRHTVSKESPPFYLKLPESGSGRQCFNNFLSSLQSKHCCVEFWGLSRPFNRISYRK